MKKQKQCEIKKKRKKFAIFFPTEKKNSHLSLFATISGRKKMGKIAGKRREARKSEEKWRTWRKKGGDAGDGEGGGIGDGGRGGRGEEDQQILAEIMKFKCFLFIYFGFLYFSN